MSPRGVWIAPTRKVDLQGVRWAEHQENAVSHMTHVPNLQEFSRSCF